ncbi:MAG: trimeric intracellular cation channel family protein [Prevotella sp.]|jgi:uncharacterized membrane protein YeiH|nr:trimeric intracellular cation channel family protein [Prevotella sp.]
MDYLLEILEFLGTFAFAISGIRHAATKKFDWFGGFICGIAVAIGGGTLRDLLLGVTPFWMTRPIYILCTILAQAFLIIFQKYIKRLDNAWFFFDTLGLALFTIAGMQKTLDMGHPFWLAIIMGTMTGAAGGVIRDVLLNNVPVIFQKEIYAIASILGGCLYWLLLSLHIDAAYSATATFFFIVIIRFLAVRYHISLPQLHLHEEE